MSLQYQILSPYTAFVGVETTGPKVDGSQLQVRYVPIQITKDDEYVSSHAAFGRLPSMSGMPGLYGAPPIQQSQSYNYPRAPPPPPPPTPTPTSYQPVADMNS